MTRAARTQVAGRLVGHLIGRSVAPSIARSVARPVALAAAWSSAAAAPVRAVMIVAAVAVAAALAPTPAHAGANAAGFQFDVIGHPFKNGADESLLKHAIAGAMQSNPAFIVATGIKAANEPCSDKLYAARHALLDETAVPVVVSLAGSDWAGCLNSAGRSNAIDRLNRLRELYYSAPESLGVKRLPLTRLSSSAKFRSYAENSHWEYGKVLFATINMPANNNHFRPEAGRNSEYEDRMVANRAWLHRLFSLAARQKMHGVVLFSDGAVGLQVEEGFSLLPRFESKQDGFAEPRRQIKTLAGKFKGKVLLVDTQSAGAGRIEPAIDWRGNVGHVSVAAEWAEVRVNPDTATLFSIKGGGAETTAEDDARRRP